MVQVKRHLIAKVSQGRPFDMPGKQINRVGVFTSTLSHHAQCPLPPTEWNRTTFTLNYEEH